MGKGQQRGMGLIRGVEGLGWRIGLNRVGEEET